jgi:two-component system chemotaxis response regulator CheB
VNAPRPFRPRARPSRTPASFQRVYTRHTLPAPLQQVDRTAPAALPVVAIVASAGGLEALTQLLGALPASFAAAVVVMQHMESGRASLLPHILGARTALRVRAAADGDALHTGTVYVAPSGRHLSIRDGRTLALTDTAPVNFSRPSADVLLDSLAGAGAPVVAVVLTGRGRDGAAGSVLVRASGGTVLAQDRESSAHFGMPGAAVTAGGVSEVLPLDSIAPRLVQLIDVLHRTNE